MQIPPKLNLKSAFNNFAERFRIQTIKLYCNILIIGWGGFPVSERAGSFGRSLIVFAPLAFAFEVLNRWFDTNQDFTLAVIFMIFLNMVFGGIMHFKKRDFDWFTLLYKTVIMIVVVLVTYFVLEIIINFAGEGLIVNGFRAALQIATLLYPGAKVLKHIFILSDGEHPPKWIMHKVYNFRENGDLNAFVSGNPEMSPNYNKDEDFGARNGKQNNFTNE